MNVELVNSLIPSFTIMIKVVKTIDTMIMTPPIVGVPDLAWWDFGPSSRILWPNFNRRKKGMIIGDSKTVIKNDIAIVKIIVSTLTAFFPFY